MKLRDFITEAPKIPSNVPPLSAYANPDNKRNRDEELSQMIKQQAEDDIADAGKAKGTYLRFKPTANYMMKAYWGKDPHIQGIKDSEYFGNVKVINAYDYTELRRLVLELLRNNPYVHVIVSSEDKAAYPDYFSKLEQILEKVDAERISYEFDSAPVPVSVQSPAVKKPASKSVSSTRSSISDEKAQQILKQIATKFPSLYSHARRAEILDIIKQNDGKIGPTIDTLRIPESYSNKSASEFIVESGTGRVGDFCEVRTNFPEADFWLTRKGSISTVGKPTSEFRPEDIGIKVTHTDILMPKYLYYMMQHKFGRGEFGQISRGTTNLVSITTDGVKKMRL